MQQAMEQALGELEESTNAAIDEITATTNESLADLQGSVDEANAAAQAAEASANRAAQIASGLESFNIRKVDSLPTIGEERTMYLVPVAGGEGYNYFDEYLWFEDSGYEYIGSTKVDLSGYVTDQELATATATTEAKINKYNMVETILYASEWQDNKYNLTVNGVTTTSVQDISFGLNITEEQIKAAQKANVIDGGQGINLITLIALGIVPTVDIPVRVLIKGNVIVDSDN